MVAARRSHGFTLLEVLVALAVLAIALGAVIKAGAENAGNLDYLREKTLAHWVAMNRVAELQLEPSWPATGTRSGEAEMGGREWRWETEVRATEDPNVRRLDVRVFAMPDGEASLTVLTAFLPNPDDA